MCIITKFGKQRLYYTDTIKFLETGISFTDIEGKYHSFSFFEISMIRN